MRVSTAEFIERFVVLSDRAEAEPITITSDGRDRLVLVAADEYARLKDRDEQAATVQGPSSANFPASDLSNTVAVPALWGALRHTITYLGEDVADASGELWDAQG